jgi:hypothetical protein
MLSWQKAARLAVGVTLATFASAAAARAEAQGHFERTLTVSGPVDMDVETGSGSINVRPGAAGRVEIHADIRAGWHVGGDVEARIHQIETNPPIEQNGNTIRIGHIEDHEFLNHISISYDITVPVETRLRSQTGSGDERIEGIKGPVDATSGSGSLRLSQIGGEVHSRTGSGDIEMESVNGNVRTSSGSGSIHATGIAGGLVASTGSGDVKLEQTAAGDVEVSTGSGEVELSGVKGGARVTTGSGRIAAEGQPSGEWRLHTGSGDVSVRFPADAAFDLSARSSSGRIETNREITVSGTLNPRELHGKVKGGGNLVDLSTSSGSIQIE